MVQVVELPDRGDPGQRHLGVDRAGQRAGRCPGSSRSATAYIRSRQVQNVPPPSWCGRAAPGGRRASGRSPRPGSDQAVEADVARRRGGAHRCRPRVMPAVGDLDPHRAPRLPSASQACSHQPGRARSRAPIGQRRRRAPRRRRGSRRRRRARPGSARPRSGCGRRASRSGPLRGEHPGVVPGAGGEHRRRPPSARRAAGRAGAASKTADGGPRLLDQRGATPAPRPTSATRPPRDRRRSSAPRGVQPGRDRRRDRVGAVRARPAPCRRWPPSRAARRPTRAAVIAAAQPQHRVVAVARAGWCRRGRPRPVRSSRQRPCGQIALATPTGASRSTSARPCSTCSSTNVPIRRSGLVVAPERAGVEPAGSASPRPSTCRRRRPARGRGRRRARR